MHDIVHGVWHLDKGMPYTLKQIFTRPGYAARDYIYGKRICYYNVFYLLLLILGFIIFFGSYLEGGLKGDVNRLSQMPDVYHFIDKYIKVIYLAFVPLIALNGFIVFRRLNYNFSEHLVASGFASVAMFMLVLINILLDILFTNTSALDNFIGVICFLVPAIVYFQIAKGLYKFGGFMLRILLFYTLIVSELAAIVIAFKLLLKAFAM